MCLLWIIPQAVTTPASPAPQATDLAVTCYFMRMTCHVFVVCLQEQVLVVGYPTGGDNTSITSGVVSRVEVTQYVHAASHLMAIQIDAAINPGGWLLAGCLQENWSSAE
jgi:hypothetical protein